MKDFPTLRAINMEWVARLYAVELFFLLGGIVLNFWLGSLHHEWFGLAAGAGFALALVVTLVQSYCFYNLVKCPVCRSKLNRFKNGRKVPLKQAYTQLQNGYGCRRCGWTPCA
jgi:hypothetical protein